MNHYAFAGLFFGLSLPRGVLLSVLPLRALDLLGDAQQVSVLFFVVSLVGITSALTQHLLIRILGSYHTFLIGIYSMALCTPLLAMEHPVGFVLGMFLHFFAIASIEVTSSLYVMHCVSRRELGRFEPLRVLAVVAALSIGPFLGVWLSEEVSATLPYAITAISALVTFIYFRSLGLHRTRLLESSRGAGNPFSVLKKFFAQPRLRLAWGLSVARSSWWVAFIIYTPIFMRNSGAGDLVGAAIVSIGTAWTLTVPFWGWVGRTRGLRFLYTLGYSTTAVLTGLVFWFADGSMLMAGLLIVAALGATILDGAGNILFFRAVRPLQRAEMTGVFLTYRDVGQLAPPGLFALLLKVFALPVVFAAASMWMFTSAAFSRYIPKRM